MLPDFYIKNSTDFQHTRIDAKVSSLWGENLADSFLPV